MQCGNDDNRCVWRVADCGVGAGRACASSGLSVPTIQRIDAGDGVIHGNVDSLMKLIAALDASGIALIGDDAASAGGGRGADSRSSARNDCLVDASAHRELFHLRRPRTNVPIRGRLLPESCHKTGLWVVALLRGVV